MAAFTYLQVYAQGGIMGHPLFDLTGRVAVVTGAAGNLGGATATAFAEAGADLLLVDLNAEGLQQRSEELRALGRRAVPVVCDVSDAKAVRAMFEQLDQEFGRIDVLANMAGDGCLSRPEDLAIEALEQVLRNLVVGRFAACQEAGRRMLAAGKGSIINTGSLASVTALGRGHIAYSMAMGAVVQMTRELAAEWGYRNVRVNAILPAQVVNKGLEDRMAADPELRKTYLRGIPMARLGDRNDIKGLAIFLASDASGWINGALIPMDGGNLALNAGGSHGWPSS